MALDEALRVPEKEKERVAGPVAESRAEPEALAQAVELELKLGATEEEAVELTVGVAAATVIEDVTAAKWLDVAGSVALLECTLACDCAADTETASLCSALVEATDETRCVAVTEIGAPRDFDAVGDVDATPD